MEIWKDIIGFEGLYQISSMGRVKSLKRYRKGKNGILTLCKEKILKQHLGKHGYLQVCLCCNNKKTAPLVHRLVGMAFIPNTNNAPCIDHIDGNRENNFIDNLRWCTTRENMNFDRVRHSISMAQKTSAACKLHQRHIQEQCKKPIICIFPNGNIEEFDSASSAELKYGFGHSNIAACCKGKAKTYKGCTFYYKAKYDELYIKGLSTRGG